jgi:hypothetical protein
MKNKHRRLLSSCGIVRAKPAAVRKKSTKLTDLRGKPVSVRSVSGLAYPVRGKLGRELAEEMS